MTDGGECAWNIGESLMEKTWSAPMVRLAAKVHNIGEMYVSMLRKP
jgi:hypothetical protein